MRLFGVSLAFVIQVEMYKLRVFGCMTGGTDSFGRYHETWNGIGGMSNSIIRGQLCVVRFRCGKFD